jgi:hypothetical protein
MPAVKLLRKNPVSIGAVLVNSIAKSTQAILKASSLRSSVSFVHLLTLARNPRLVPTDPFTRAM